MLGSLEEEYETRTYEEMSKECRVILRRTTHLVKQMYYRLTRIDGLPYEEAIHKIVDDHRDIRGFSPRNVQRCLPANDPTVKRRVRTNCLKSSSQTESSRNISVTEQDAEKIMERYDQRLLELDNQRADAIMEMKNIFDRQYVAFMNVVEMILSKIENIAKINAATPNGSLESYSDDIRRTIG